MVLILVLAPCQFSCFGRFTRLRTVFILCGYNSDGYANVAQLVEHVLGKNEVSGSIPDNGL